jgi:hypothetical protein
VVLSGGEEEEDEQMDIAESRREAFRLDWRERVVSGEGTDGSRFIVGVRWGWDGMVGVDGVWGRGKDGIGCLCELEMGQASGQVERHEMFARCTCLWFQYAIERTWLDTTHKHYPTALANESMSQPNIMITNYQ